jgi:hypothetical protein
MEPQPEVIYQVTLPSGMVVTSPHEFGSPHVELGTAGPIITLDGRVLVPPTPRPIKGTGAVAGEATIDNN